jgi:hypothetical protein
VASLYPTSNLFMHEQGRESRVVLPMIPIERVR